MTPPIDTLTEEKEHAIEAIRRFNPTASPTFLAGFSDKQLQKYLTRLEGVFPGGGCRANSFTHCESDPSSTELHAGM